MNTHSQLIDYPRRKSDKYRSLRYCIRDEPEGVRVESGQGVVVGGRGK